MANPPISLPSCITFDILVRIVSFLHSPDLNKCKLLWPYLSVTIDRSSSSRLCIRLKENGLQQLSSKSSPDTLKDLRNWDSCWSTFRLNPLEMLIKPPSLETERKVFLLYRKEYILRSGYFIEMLDGSWSFLDLNSAAGANGNHTWMNVKFVEGNTTYLGRVLDIDQDLMVVARR